LKPPVYFLGVRLEDKDLRRGQFVIDVLTIPLALLLLAGLLFIGGYFVVSLLAAVF
jgi:hypothetical protein